MSGLTKTEIAWHMQAHLDSIIKMDANYSSPYWADRVKELSKGIEDFLYKEAQEK